VPMQVMVDDSGGEGQAVLAFGGLIGRAGQWAVFYDRWDQCLHTTPRIDYFKMREAERRTGQFRGFTDEQRDQKLLALTRTLDQLEIEIIYAGLDVTIFAELLQPLNAKPADKPYFYTFYSMIQSSLYELRERGERDRFEVIFDEQKSLGPRVKYWYPYVREALERSHPYAESMLPVEPLFRSDRDVLPLQAADMVASVVRRLFLVEPNEFAWVGSELLKHVTVSAYSQFFGRPEIRRLAEGQRYHELRMTDAEIQRINDLLERGF
jgi:hypothetical protein